MNWRKNYYKNVEGEFVFNGVRTLQDTITQKDAALEVRVVEPTATAPVWFYKIEEGAPVWVYGIDGKSFEEAEPIIVKDLLAYLEILIPKASNVMQDIKRQKGVQK